MIITTRLAALAPVYYRPDFGEAQAKALFSAFVEDLCDFAVCDLEEAIRGYRRDARNKFFPTPAQIRTLAQAAYKDRLDADEYRSRPAPKESRPQMWWLLSRWKPDWHESDIPAEHVEAYRARRARQEQRQRLSQHTGL